MEKPDTIHDFKEHKLLTINVLIIVKDQLIISSINMTHMLSYVFNDQLDELAEFLSERIMVLEKSGVDYIAIASNTPHIVFDQLAEKAKVPLISIVEETCKVIASNKLKRLGLFGTKSTMISGFYNKVAGRYGIEIKTPSPDKQDYIHGKYMSELVFNKIIPETKEQLIRIIQELKKKESIEGLILGGTELPLILKQSDFKDITIFDTTKIHVESIVTKMIEN